MASWCRRALRHAPAIWAEKSTGTTGPISAQILSMSQLLRWKWKSEKSIATGTHNSELPSARLSCYGPIILDGGRRRAVGSRRPMNGAPGGQHFCSGREPSGLPALWGREKAPPPVGAGLKYHHAVLWKPSFEETASAAGQFRAQGVVPERKAPPKRGQVYCGRKGLCLPQMANSGEGGRFLRQRALATRVLP